VISYTPTEAELTIDLIAEWLRKLAATSPDHRGAYLYAAEGVERGDWRP
jgi:hypothetical protein